MDGQNNIAISEFLNVIIFLVRSCFSLISNNAYSILGNKLAYFRDRFAININQCILNDNIKKIKLSTVISDDEQLIINNIWSLLLVKSSQYSVQGFNVSEIGDILIFFATSSLNYIFHNIIHYDYLSFIHFNIRIVFYCYLFCYMYTIYCYVYDINK